MFNTRLSIAKQCFFFKRLAYLISAGVPLLEALHILEEQASSRSECALIGRMSAEVNEGQSLYRALSKRANNFNHFSISIVRIGEQSGTLASNLVYLSEELRKKQQLKRLVIGACIYPLLITGATLGITIFLMLYLFPKITPVFMSMHVALPLSTQIVMQVSIFLEHWGLAVVAGTVSVVGLGIVLLQKSAAVHFLFDAWSLRLPFIGNVIRSYNTSQSTRTLGLLLKSGIRLSEAVPITAEGTHNLVYKKELLALGKAVEQGEKISNYLQKSRSAYPPTMRHLVAVGERSGSLSETLLYIAEASDYEVNEFTKHLSVMLEPVLMIGMGLLVGFIAISIITPLYGITQGLHG